ncbi:MAG: type II toxin-antitoxin system RelE/ParE family toxin [Myxococcota bacterium]
MIVVTFEPEAEAETRAAFDWYEAQSPNLGMRFLQAVGEAIDRISESPRGFPAQFRGLRRVLVRRFPYAVYYRVHSEHLSVVAVFHARRSPRLVKTRSQES